MKMFRMFLVTIMMLFGTVSVSQAAIPASELSVSGITLNDSIEKIKSVWGEPTDVEYYYYNAGKVTKVSGCTVTYRWGYGISVMEENIRAKKPYVSHVMFNVNESGIDDGITLDMATKANIRRGSTLDEVYAAYGTPDNNTKFDNNIKVLNYSAGEGFGLAIMLENDLVTTVILSRN